MDKTKEQAATDAATEQSINQFLDREPTVPDTS